MSKATELEIENRIDYVFEMYVKGASTKYILRHCSEKWNISNRQIETYLQRAKNYIDTHYNDEYKKGVLNRALAQVDNLYVKNYTIEDFRECRNIIESKCKLLGLYPTKQIELTAKLEQPLFPDVQENDSNE